MSLNKKAVRRSFTVNARNFRLDLGKTTKIMGIVNITPDSFSQDGCIKNRDFTPQAVTKARRLIRQGADIIDIGGESTRPGAAKISIQEEIIRVIPAIKILAKSTKVPISVDTYKSRVAKEALDAGASIVNNIKGTLPEKSLLQMVKRYNAAIVLMHIRGTPRTMQKNIHYQDLMDEIVAALRNSIEICLENGLESDRIILDPGIGFGKTPEHNLEILNRLAEFKTLKYPILMGTSRKSFIGKVLDKDVKQRLMGTAATVCASILNGAHIVRVHDVKEISNTVKMTDAIMNQHLPKY